MGRVPDYVIDVWQSEDGLPQNSVVDIVQARDGFLWVLTAQALARFDGVRFTVFDEETWPELAHVGVQDLIADRQGTIWLSTARGGLLRWNEGRFIRCLRDEGDAVIGVFGEPLAILVVPEDGPPFVATSHHVMPSTGPLDSQKARHVGTLETLPAIVNFTDVTPMHQDSDKVEFGMNYEMTGE